MDSIVSALSSALSGSNPAHDVVLSVDPPSSYSEWPEDQKRTDNIGDELGLADERLRLLVHVISPEWVEVPELFAESRLTENSTLKLDKIDKQQITNVCCGCPKFLYKLQFMFYFF